MEKLRRLGAAEETRELDLAASRRQQIVAADDVRDPLHPVVDRRGELIRPVFVAVAHEKIAALVGRALLLRAVPQIDEALHGRLEPNTDAKSGTFNQPAIATRAGIPDLVTRS